MLHHFFGWLQQTFQAYPELAIFLALSAGFFIGNLKLGKFTPGTVTGVLLVGVLVGQMHINISPNVQSVFFLMFLFAVGYSVGPQFFRGLKKDGLPQVLFAVLMCLTSLVTIWLLSRFMKYNPGEAAGLLSGSQTASAVIGVASSTIKGLDISENDKETFINVMPVCYAITYFFGTAGSAWLLASIGPKLLGGIDRVRAQCRELEKQLGGGSTSNPNMREAFNTTTIRAYRITANSIAINKTIRQLEHDLLLRQHRVFIQRVRNGDGIHNTDPDILLKEGDVIVIRGRREFVLPEADGLGTEIIDKELLDFPVMNVPVYVIHKQAVGRSIKELALQEYMYGVMVQKIIRSGIQVPLFIETKIEKGDRIELAGPKEAVDRAISYIGYAEVSTEETDLVFVGIGIVLGGLVGSLAIHAGSIPISLSTSGGALIAGLVLGWLRSQHTVFGQIPAPVIWFMNNIGLNVFIAAVGISSGPGFIAGLKETGFGLFFTGIAATTIPILAGILMGKYLFKFHPALILGCAAGARKTTAGLLAVQDALQSKLPALGYTVTYAVSNTLLIIWGIIIVLLMAMG